MKHPLSTITLVAAVCLPWAVASGQETGSTPQRETTVETKSDSAPKGPQQATFGGGCFWCVEAVFQEVKGVTRVVSGYSGGKIPNPTYKQVTSGLTGHAEVVQITYDPNVITYPEMLEIFWKTHDPTTRNRQGNDIGTQYRSIILAHDAEQLRTAGQYKAKLNESRAFSRPIVTEIEPLRAFYPAEDYHQNYFRSNPDQAYCQFVIVPKMAKFREVFREKLQP